MVRERVEEQLQMSQEYDGTLGIKEAAQMQNSSSTAPQRASAVRFSPGCTSTAVVRLNVPFLHWYVVDAPYGMGQINPCPCLNPCVFQRSLEPSLSPPAASPVPLG